MGRASEKGYAKGSLRNIPPVLEQFPLAITRPFAQQVNKLKDAPPDTTTRTCLLCLHHSSVQKRALWTGYGLRARVTLMRAPYKWPVIRPKLAHRGDRDHGLSGARLPPVPSVARLVKQT